MTEGGAPLPHQYPLWPWYPQAQPQCHEVLAQLCSQQLPQILGWRGSGSYFGHSQELRVKAAPTWHHQQRWLDWGMAAGRSAEWSRMPDPPRSSSHSPEVKCSPQGSELGNPGGEWLWTGLGWKRTGTAGMGSPGPALLPDLPGTQQGTGRPRTPGVRVVLYLSCEPSSVPTASPTGGSAQGSRARGVLCSGRCLPH